MRKIVVMLMMSLAVQAQAMVSGLDAKQFKKYWQVESESPDYRVTFSGDTCEILSPKGLTLWRKEKMKAGMTVEYDACVVDEGMDGDRLSDMNCFWLASDPHAKDLWARSAWRSGIFVRCYTLQMYYLGYGGNHNTTTRFRRYDGDDAGVEDATKRPAILKEYTDKAHLLKANHWYHVKIESKMGHTRFFIDGECIVDYFDPRPLESGWFGFRTTLSRTRLTNFKAYESPMLSYQTTGVPLHWISNNGLNGLNGLSGSSCEDENPLNLCNPLLTGIPVSFGVPFAQGELKDVSQLTLSGDIPTDAWVNARWPDGSVKWAGIAAVVPMGSENLLVNGEKSRKKNPSLFTIHSSLFTSSDHIVVNTGQVTAYIPQGGTCLMDSLCLNGKRVGGKASLVASTATDTFCSDITGVEVERSGRVRTVVKVEGVHRSQTTGRVWLPFVVRLYFYQGSDQVKMVHTFIYNGKEQQDMITSLGIRFQIPMREDAYNRHVAFATDESGVWAEPVQLLDQGNDRSRLRALQLVGETIASDSLPFRTRQYLNDWAKWDGFRLSQLTDNAFSVRKRATSESPWIGTFTGGRAPGYAFVGDTQGGLGVALKDFWQSYPSTIEVGGARGEEAELTMWLWSPEAEPMNLCHYDTVAHGLRASYEDVQEGMSTAYGIARTSELWLLPQAGYQGKACVAEVAERLTAEAHLLPTPEYLYEKRAFGIWSLPNEVASSQESAVRKDVERRLKLYTDFYLKAIEQHKWYGFWNYGDLMHAYDPERHSWRYDVGGYAWDNTELATPMWLWYNFLRTGRADLFRMAEAMTRHCSEVDVYHIGPFAPLGSRHNVSHWGCGAKEARISQAAFNRFYYYLTTDERTGDLMSAQRDADTLLLHLDPMRLAEPRSQYPCNAPARLRFGPDWLAYAGNWMTEWERFETEKYRDKILTGLASMAALEDGIFTGNLAKGYDPATGRISYDGDPSVRSTNHLMTIMGGFEVMNELMDVLSNEEWSMWNGCWLDFARRYKQMAAEVRHNHFPVRRLEAYAAWQDRDPERVKSTWEALWGEGDHGLQLADTPHEILPPEVSAPLDELRGLSTNNAALWSLDAIYMSEVLP